YPPGELVSILFEYGEEKFAKNIVRAIVKAREQAPVTSTVQLAELIKGAVPAAVRRDGHPARKTFQALRIAVNGELDHLKLGLKAAFSLLKPQGRLSVITFHSLEDRIVKQQFAAWCKGCTCPPDFPVCVCGKTPQGKLLTRKPQEADEQELLDNPRSRSAKLRTIIRR
ncbi:MAG: 16S rRNA (cytosine(1402)-N(4))-methyltransferase RsmH, partial [Clostridiales bacterium]|nr:16S rRNA (cytosine(1402)-N(4))-methyltransferase RsmH [Clostridiales bacterium]